MDDCQIYWELPATAHFCSLFRNVFKLLDFDIDDLEEALTVDTLIIADGGRSTLLVDLLIALIKGCLNRKDVSLLNYNFYLWDLLQIEWVSPGFGPNPMGDLREKASFHSLPKHIKIKLLWHMCEWRLEKSDVEALTKNLSGDSLRIQPLGRDDNQATYWYFFGTRLYKEDAEPLKLNNNTTNSNKITDGMICGLPSISTPTGKSTPKKKPKKTGWAGGVRGKRGRKKKPTNEKNKSQSSTTEISPRRSLRNACKESLASFNDVDVDEEEEEDEESEVDEDSDSEEQSTASIPRLRITKGTSVKVEESSSDEDVDDSQMMTESPAPLSNRRPSAKSRLKAELLECSRNNTPTPSDTGQSNAAMSLCNDEDSRMSRDDQLNTNTQHTNEEVEMLDETLEASTLNEELDAEVADIKAQADIKNVDMKMPDDLLESERQQAEIKQEHTENLDIKPFIEEQHLSPCNQPLLKVDLVVAQRWHVLCQTAEDWQSVVESFKGSKSRNERELYKLLKDEFQPTIQEIYEQKEKERLVKYAELNRRSSNRLEFKRFKREDEARSLQSRENAERRKLAQQEAAKQLREDVELREKRSRLRDIERQKAVKLKDKMREDRTKRLEIRRKRQELQRLGMVVPPELMNNSIDGDESDSSEGSVGSVADIHSQLQKIIEQVSSCKDSAPFHKPVSEDIAPDYYTVIKNPMCISRVEQKIHNQDYNSKIDFVQDINAIFLNCLTYNGVQSEYTKLAQRLERTFIKAWKKYFPPTELINMTKEEQANEFKCINMMGKLDKQIRHTILGESSSEEEEMDIDVGNVNVDKGEIASISNKSQMDLNPHSYAKPNTSFSQLRNRTAEIKPIVRKDTTTRQSSFQSPFTINSQPRYPAFSPSTPRNISPRVQLMSNTRSTLHTSNVRSRFYSPNRPQNYSTYSITNYRDEPPPRSTIPIENTASQPAPQQQDKPTVYLLQMPDGNRMLKFVTKDGKQAPSHLVNQVLPSLRQQAHTFPKGVVTVTLDAMPPEEQNQPSTSANQTIMPSTSTSESTLSNHPLVDNEMRRKASQVASELSSVLSNSHSRLFNLGNNQYLTVQDGQPWILRKELNGNYKRIQRIEKSQLEAKLQEIQLRKSIERKKEMNVTNKSGETSSQPLPDITYTPIPAPIPPVAPNNSAHTRPVCSVAPQVKNIVRPPNAGVGNTQTTASGARLLIIGGNQTSIRPAMQRQTSQVIQVQSPVVLNNNSQNQPMQLIQLSMPQITINAGGNTLTQANSSQPANIGLPGNELATTSTHINVEDTDDLLAEAWQATEEI